MSLRVKIFLGLLASCLLLTGRASVTPSRIVVEPLLTTAWGQGASNNQPGGTRYVYNYYTPNHAYCGCVATMMAQIMKYHEWPKTAVAQKSFDCHVEGVATNLTLMGGAYDWANMTPTPSTSWFQMTDANKQAIGRLCYDAALSVNMKFSQTASSANGLKSAAALKETFGYARATALAYDDAHPYAANADEFERLVRENLDAGRPVGMGIGRTTSSGGHVVVVDGYAYGAEGQFLLHVNTGFCGQDTGWYAPPDFSFTNSSNGSYDKVTELIYDIIPEEAPSARDCFMDEHWSQTKPYNDLVPAYLPAGTGDTGYEGWGGHVTAGCVATAMAQTMHYWGWPRYFDRTKESSHSVNLDKGKVAFSVAHQIAAGVPLAYDDSDACKARLTFVAASLGQLAFDRDGTGGRPETVANALTDCYVVPPSCDDTDLRNYLLLGYPVPATIATHAIVLCGWKRDEQGVEWYWKNNGQAGGGDGWIRRSDILSLHPILPKRTVMFAPLPKRTKQPFTVSWSFPEAYLKIYPEAFEGFVLKAIPSSSKGTSEVSVTLDRNARGYTFDRLTEGETYSIEVEPRFKALAEDDPTVFISPVTASVMTTVDASAADAPKLSAPGTVAVPLTGCTFKVSGSAGVESLAVTPSLKRYTFDKSSYELADYIGISGGAGDFTVRIRPIDFLDKSDNYNLVLTFTGETADGSVAYAETIVNVSAENKGEGSGGRGVVPRVLFR